MFQTLRLPDNSCDFAQPRVGLRGGPELPASRTTSRGSRRYVKPISLFFHWILSVQHTETVPLLRRTPEVRSPSRAVARIRVNLKDAPRSNVCLIRDPLSV